MLALVSHGPTVYLVTVLGWFVLPLDGGPLVVRVQALKPYCHGPNSSWAAFGGLSSFYVTCFPYL